METKALDLSEFVRPATSKDYETINGTRIENTPEGRKVIRESALDPNFDILQDNRRRFPKIFGKRSCQWTGYIKHDVWLIDPGEKAKVFLLTSREGTSIEYAGPPEKVGIAANFLKERVIPALRIYDESGKRRTPEELCEIDARREEMCAPRIADDHQQITRSQQR